MKTQKELLKLFNKAKGEHTYYDFEDFLKDTKNFIKDIKQTNTYCSIKVSNSGMTRKFNFHKYNMLLNICYNEKFSWDPVKVNGCGMDMHWYLLFRTCQELIEKNKIDPKYNNLCSYGIIL